RKSGRDKGEMTAPHSEIGERSVQKEDCGARALHNIWQQGAVNVQSFAQFLLAVGIYHCRDAPLPQDG
ncbi:MAG: hypothetical protein L6Q76_00445, partial [Polyangiaceae bacterium]|nr:hypothetical protein [Polyangiaceae bacterium]